MSVRYATYSRPLSRALQALDGMLGLVVRQRHGPVPGLDSTVQRILVCNQGHLGDAILSTAVFVAIQRRFPNAEIAVLVHPGSAVVFNGSSDVRRVHTVEHWHLNRRNEAWPIKLLRHWRSARQAVDELRAHDYQLAIDLRPFFPNSIPLLRWAGICHIVGWTSAGCGAWLTHAAHDDGLTVNMVDRHRRLLALIDIPAVDLASMVPRLHVSEGGAAGWAATRANRGIGGRYVIVHVGAHTAQRRWSEQRWSVLVATLLAQHQTVVLLGHGEAEIRVCAAIALQCPGAIDLSGQLSWEALVAAIDACELLLSHDSAATHVGAALDRPRICIASGIHDLSLWLRPDERSVVCVNPMPCAPCGRVAGCEHMACLRGVDPLAVARTASQLLSATVPAGAATGLVPPTSRLLQ